MKIDQVIETQEGTVVFQGTLEGEELTYVINLGLHLLMLQGALPMVKRSEKTPEPNKEDMH